MSKKNKRVNCDISLSIYICEYAHMYMHIQHSAEWKLTKFVSWCMKQWGGGRGKKTAGGLLATVDSNGLHTISEVHCVISKCSLNFWEEPIATLEWVFRMKTFLPLKFCSLLHKLSWTHFLLSFLMTSFMLPSLQVHLISESLSKKEEGSSIHFFF